MALRVEQRLEFRDAERGDDVQLVVEDLVDRAIDTAVAEKCNDVDIAAALAGPSCPGSWRRQNFLIHAQATAQNGTVFSADAEVSALIFMDAACSGMS